MYFTGYARPTSCGIFAPDELKHRNALSVADQQHIRYVYCGAAEAALSDQDQRDRDELVDVGLRLATDLGTHGSSPFVQQLDYVDYNNLFVVPVAHAGLLGVVKDFWYHLLQTGRGVPAYVISGEARRVLQERASCMVPTCDFGRQYTDIVSKKGNWVMEDWLHWAECWSVFMLGPYVVDGISKPVLNPMVSEMWGHLRAGLLYFCRSHPVEGVAQDADAASGRLRQYAVLVEQRFGLKMCKFNLHLVVCRLAAQEAERGLVAHSTEYWLENLIQWAKSTVRYRTTKYPELVLAGDILLDDAIARCCAQHEDVRAALRDWEHVDVLGSTFTNPDAGSSDGSQLLGRGRELGVAERGRLGVDAAVVTFIERFAPPGWSLDMVEQACVVLYTYAQSQRGEILHSTQYTRARSRVSYNVLCQLWDNEGGGSSSSGVREPDYYVGKIKYFVKVVAPAAMDVDGVEADVGAGAAAVPVTDLRLAVMDLHLLQVLDAHEGVSYQSVTYCSGLAHHLNTAFNLSFDEEAVGTIIAKHALAKEAGKAFFLPYSNMSASGEDV
jgi:hypothetical protein